MWCNHSHCTNVPFELIHDPGFKPSCYCFRPRHAPVKSLYYLGSMGRSEVVDLILVNSFLGCTPGVEGGLRKSPVSLFFPNLPRCHYVRFLWGLYESLQGLDLCGGFMRKSFFCSRKSGILIIFTRKNNEAFARTHIYNHSLHCVYSLQSKTKFLIPVCPSVFI